MADAPDTLDRLLADIGFSSLPAEEPREATPLEAPLAYRMHGGTWRFTRGPYASLLRTGGDYEWRSIEATALAMDSTNAAVEKLMSDLRRGLGEELWETMGQWAPDGAIFRLRGSVQIADVEGARPLDDEPDTLGQAIAEWEAAQHMKGAE